MLAQELASRDALTGLKNRLTFDQELRDAFAPAIDPQRSRSRCSISISTRSNRSTTRWGTSQATSSCGSRANG